MESISILFQKEVQLKNLKYLGTLVVDALSVGNPEVLIGCTPKTEDNVCFCFSAETVSTILMLFKVYSVFELLKLAVISFFRRVLKYVLISDNLGGGCGP